MYSSYFKRVFDVIIALFGLIVISPILLFTIIGIRLFQGGNAFYFQDRPGKDSKIFKVIKFKTMTDEKDESGNLLPDEKRLTRLGKFIRATSIDELPQLINVLKGDMSIVGPRPLMVKYLPLYSAFQARRHEVRPGITGWAQVSGRNAISWQKKFEYDVWYVDNVSFMLDIKILLLTVKKVLKRDGISSGTSATMEAFKGNEKPTELHKES